MNTLLDLINKIPNNIECWNDLVNKLQISNQIISNFLSILVTSYFMQSEMPLKLLKNSEMVNTSLKSLEFGQKRAENKLSWNGKVAFLIQSFNVVIDTIHQNWEENYRDIWQLNRSSTMFRSGILCINNTKMGLFCEASFSWPSKINPS